MSAAPGEESTHPVLDGGAEVSPNCQLVSLPETKDGGFPTLANVASPKLFSPRISPTTEAAPRAPGVDSAGAAPGGRGRRREYLFRGAGGWWCPEARCPAEPGRMLPEWVSTLRITPRRCRLCDQTFQQLRPTVLAMHLAIICWRRRPAPCSCDWLPGPGQDCIGFERPHSGLGLLLLSKPSKGIILCFIDNL